MRWATLALSFLCACDGHLAGPHADVEFTVSNEAGRSLAMTALCVQHRDSLRCEPLEDGLSEGETTFGMLEVAGELGEERWIGAIAEDENGDVYLWGPTLVEVAPTVEIDVRISAQECCYTY